MYGFQGTRTIGFKIPGYEEGSRSYEPGIPVWPGSCLEIPAIAKY